MMPQLTMAEPERLQNRHRSSLVWCALAILALLVLYQLSVGPVAWLEHHQKLPDLLVPIVAIIYAPVGFTASNCQWYGNLLDRYLLLWGVEL